MSVYGDKWKQPRQWHPGLPFPKGKRPMGMRREYKCPWCRHINVRYSFAPLHKIVCERCRRTFIV